MPEQFWNVYNYIAQMWYSTEYGAVEQRDRWYQPAMIEMELMALREREVTA